VLVLLHACTIDAFLLVVENVMEMAATSTLRLVHVFGILIGFILFHCFVLKFVFHHHVPKPPPPNDFVCINVGFVSIILLGGFDPIGEQHTYVPSLEKDFISSHPQRIREEANIVLQQQQAEVQREKLLEIQRLEEERDNQDARTNALVTNINNNNNRSSIDMLFVRLNNSKSMINSTVGNGTKYRVFFVFNNM
jgi:hypothetical protein